MKEMVVPALQAKAFTCPTCGAYAGMVWSQAAIGGTYAPIYRAVCQACNFASWWLRSGLEEGAAQMMWPTSVTAPPAHPDLFPDLQADYEEARSISKASPRSAAALLRLVIEKLVIELGAKGDNINAMIGDLVKRGLFVQVQQALDSVRVIGNNALHPGKMDQADVVATANQLFGLVNIIVEQQITQPKKIAELFGTLPEGARNWIDKRDATK
ncbi:MULTISPECIES: DUF4145 domain-containing protein [unclassified Caballeronia]|uniref:DUF4145 domain-containing protein n=1 Tax=unclassified Caballeronia TaxID=2646786 RepID=UPI002866FB49|nr:MULTISPECIES: DUF4145 domain-containing protein [unclassified Caballeronia]MDR5771806.1 DUF4145 domain-containing protein [Caballeronia sp. LZ002]MDR5847241.1 DUF4145 domain-containing protein [Caballeronia sp. LZ003]